MANDDRYGLALTPSSPTEDHRFQEGMDRLLSFGAGAEAAFAAAIAADDGLAVAHAGSALVAVVQGDAAGARAAAGRARETVAGATRRERQHVEAVSALITGETARGLALVDEHVAEFPRDALLVNQAGSAIGFAGGSDREHQRLAFVERLAPAYGDDWWFASALAFTYHEVDRFEESRRLSERSLAQYPGNAGASHNLAHVYFETVDNDAGAAFLEAWLARYDPRASFHCHLAWHHALFELSMGCYARVMELYQCAIRPDVARTRTSMYDAASLLWRYQIYGCAQDELPWSAVGELAARGRRYQAKAVSRTEELHRLHGIASQVVLDDTSDFVVMNAGAACYVAGMADSLLRGAEMIALPAAFTAFAPQASQAQVAVEVPGVGV